MCKAFHKWQRKGVRQQIHDELSNEVRKKKGRSPDFSVVVADPQSIKTTGLLLGLLVTEANASERLGGG
ncbi:hypothetical protein IQE94_10735 [Synechocystis sp. PCC 7339]|uniref:hypothetical protein n=1 Tax=unclassified Synechocystis TaxID=2640012 RepID=UPI001BAEE6E3|nr:MULTISPECIES: hypothetical protein [unclassified Synechocystis]QUS59438.1 hypothetical protein HTZ78_01235 [Synechocystis sp. PCC 7338]UAJ71622.1 hypothetical protein IQE94_10735 [Synechocystis sp. PCC 7339]